MKTEVGTVDATPTKRLFLSIIADYDLNKSICELVDNALDVWVKDGKAEHLTIDISLDTRQQIIVIQDNAGGLRKDDLRYIIGPGQSGTGAGEKTIGIFGVGTKRAVVAIAQMINIRTRHKRSPTYEIDVDDAWVQLEEWELPVYQVSPIREGTTIIELAKLRVHLDDVVIEHLTSHLQATYAKFLSHNKVTIHVQDKPLTPHFFENWAYPPSYEPSRYTGTLSIGPHTIDVEVLAGLTTESSPASGEYGVYFYCNNRLVARALKTYEVGFTKGLAGVPHPKISLTRVLVSLTGDAQCMPWNSSKSDINTKHEVFLALRDWLVQVVKDYAALSRMWVGEWPEKVFQYKSGVVAERAVEDFPSIRKSLLPPLPKVRPRYAEIITQQNKSVVEKKPWTRGLYEGVIAAELIVKQRLEQKNRIALIVLDSTLEIAFKEFLVNESGDGYGDERLQKIFKNRGDVHKEVQAHVKIDQDTWKKVAHYYHLRCELVHKKATMGITDDQIADYKAIVEKILRRLYKLKF